MRGFVEYRPGKIKIFHEDGKWGVIVAVTLMPWVKYFISYEAALKYAREVIFP